MDANLAEGLFNKNHSPNAKQRTHSSILCLCLKSIGLLIVCLVALQVSCVSDKADHDTFLTSYQRALADEGPQPRIDTEGKDHSNPLGILKPVPSGQRKIPEVEIATDPNTTKRTANLTIEQAIVRTLANSPEIRIVSCDPSVAREDITKAAAEFDPTTFGRLNHEQEDNPVNSIYTPGQSDTRILESGIKQKTTIGSEWSASYAISRNWDDLAGRTLSTRYEPMLVFQLRQPLFRDAWQEINLAGVNIAKLDYEIALLDFRQKAEDVSTEVIATYWQLFQARRDLEIQQHLLDRTLETLMKVQGRRDIDATDVQIKQAEASVKVREAVLIQDRKRIKDVQDALIRLMADPQMNTVTDLEIMPVTIPYVALEGSEQLTSQSFLELALKKNPVVQQARLAIQIADINIQVAGNQKMPRIDLVASARTQGIASGPENAQDRLNSGDYTSYAIGLTLEYPLGNRQREAERLQRRFLYRKAVSTLQNTADQVAAQVKEKVRQIEMNLAEINIQKQAAEATRMHLQALEASELIREQLTPEFLLVKLQAQESLAQAERAEASAIVDFNISWAQLAQSTGTVLELHQVKTSLPPWLGPDTGPGDSQSILSTTSDILMTTYCSIRDAVIGALQN
jgi:outer membrane protein TolC